jgi:hypothetical protein
MEDGRSKRQLALGLGLAEQDPDEGVVGGTEVAGDRRGVLGYAGEDGRAVEVDVEDGGDGLADGPDALDLLVREGADPARKKASMVPGPPRSSKGASRRSTATSASAGVSTRAARAPTAADRPSV